MNPFDDPTKEELAVDNVWIFDFDGTLFDSVAKVYAVNRDTRERKALTREEYYSTYKFDPSVERFDYSEYEDPEVLKKGIALPMLENMLNIDQNIDKSYMKGTLYILTARVSKVENAIFELLQENGIKTLKRENVITTGDLEIKTGKSRHQLKKEILETLRKKHTGKVFFIDDEEENIRNAMTIEGISPIKIG